MVTRDPLAAWWQHEVILRRLDPGGSWGPGLKDPEPLKAAVDDTARQVRDASGTEVVSSTTVVLPAATGYVPPGSTVTLPASHGARQALVIACQVAVTGLPHSPDHVSLHLE